MDAQNERLIYLFHRYNAAACSEAEVGEYMHLVSQEQYGPLLQELILSQLEQDEAHLVFPAVRAQQVLDSITQPHSRFKIRTLVGWVSAAAVILLVLAGAWILWAPHGDIPKTIAASTDKRPASAKATLTLADGSIVTLDENGNQVIQQGNIAIRQQGGSLVYNTGNSSANGFNTLSTPRGGQFFITLPDGTRVWLNAATTLRYPMAFQGGARKVQVSGEAYFEVAPRAAMPFKVEAGNKGEIEVLGTRFNVNTYQDEPLWAATLLQGSIKVIQREAALPKEMLLKPGSQAFIEQGELHMQPVDTAVVMAWKNGFFSLDGIGVAGLMRQLERWYNIDVVYPNGIPNIRLFGKISRDKSLNNFLKAMEFYEIKYKREGNRLVILP